MSEEFEGIRKAIQDQDGKFLSTTIRGFTKDDFEEMIDYVSKQEPNNDPHPTLISVGFLESCRESYGDDFLYKFITTHHLMGGRHVWDYIQKFIREYEENEQKAKKANVRNKRK